MSPLDSIIAQEERDQLSAAIRALPETERLILRMVDIEGFSESDTSRCTAVSMAKVRSALFRARERLKLRIAGI